MITLFLFFLLQDNPYRAYRGNINDDPELVGQRLVHEGTVKLDKHGNGAISFIPMFKFPPSCSIVNKTNPKRPIEALDSDSVDHLLLKGKAGDRAEVKCRGISAPPRVETRRKLWRDKK